MKSAFSILLLCIFSVFNSEAQINCDPCTPLAEVAITNSGLERIIELSLYKNFQTFNEEVVNRAGFRDLKLDYDIDSNCAPSTLETAVKKKIKGSSDACFGLPQLTDTSIGSDTQLRPFHAGMSKMNLDKLKLKLDGPIKCKQLECEFKVAVQDLKISGDLEVLFKDGKKENFIPKSRFEVESTDNSKLVYSMKAYIDPKTGQLQDLVQIKDKSSSIEVGANSLQTKLNLNTTFKSEQQKKSLYQKYYATKNKFTARSREPQFAENAYKDMRQNMISRLATDPEFDELKHSQLEKIVDEIIQEKLGGKNKMIQNIKAVKWPNANNSEEVNQFINNPPEIMRLVPEFSDQMHLTKIYAAADNSGYDNVENAVFAQAAIGIGQFLHGSDLFNSAILKPAFEKEIIPTVEKQANADMRNLPAYWKEISEVPSLNLQNLIDSDEITEKINQLQKQIEAQGPKETNKKIALKQQLSELYLQQIRIEEKTANDWLPIDTKVMLDKNSRAMNMIRGNVMKNNDSNCSNTTPKFSDRKDSDFDISTKLNTGTLQHYMDAMAKSKKLDMCLGGQNPNTCKGGTKITLDKPPKISCDNGKIAIDIDAEIKKKLFRLLTITPDAAAKLKMTVENCNGDPCIQVTDVDGKFKNVFFNGIDSLFGGLLQRGISSAVNVGSKTPLAIPDVKLKKTTTDKNTCETTMDWMIQSPFPSKNTPAK